jgi:hypothetical protein
MAPFEQQLAEFQRWKGGAASTRLTSGFLITVPDVRLPEHEKWSAPNTSIRFIVPNGYPFASPDCFWADQSLRLRNLALPQATNVQQIPETTQTGLWFSWHARAWNPSQDSLVTYFNVILNRLRQAV